MTTNNQIKEKYEVSSIIGRKLNTIDNMLNEARADTAREIFKELDKILGKWTTSEVVKMIIEMDKDKHGWNVDDYRWKHNTMNLKDYRALKKKYNIEG
jgi:hypothetical protein